MFCAINEKYVFLIFSVGNNSGHVTCFRPEKVIWHGAHMLGERAMDAYCDSWHSDSSDKVGLASSLLRGKLLAQERFTCNHRFAVLCIEAVNPNLYRRRRRSAEDSDGDDDDDDDDFLDEDEYQDFLKAIMDENEQN